MSMKDANSSIGRGGDHPGREDRRDVVGGRGLEQDKCRDETERGDHRDIVVIGGGPAGVAAAIQLKRGGLDPLLLERDRIGGLLREANLIENYPGFPSGIAGRELADLLAAHVARAGIEMSFVEVVRLEHGEDAFAISLVSGRESRKRTVTADRVVIASGTAPNVLRGVRILGEASGRVHYSVQSLDAVDGGNVAIIGGGDAAFDYALNLASRNDVVILHRGERPRCIPALEERAAADPRIVYRSNVAVEEIVTTDDGVILQCRSGTGDETERYVAEHALVAIGRAPSLDFLHAGIGQRAAGLRERGLLYLIGDVANGALRQAAISAGDGVRAAMEILERRRAVPDNEAPA